MKPIIVALLGAVLLSGCEMSSDSQAKTQEALCAQSSSSIQSLTAGGAAARAAAALIRDNTDDPQVRKVATAVADNRSDRAGRKYLANWLSGQCRNT